MASGDSNGHVADNEKGRPAIGILAELGSACRELKASAEAAREEEQRLVGLELNAAAIHGRPNWEKRPAARLLDLQAQLADRHVDSLEEAHAGWVAWYAAAASELLIDRAAGNPLRPDAIERWQHLRHGGRDTCPELPDDGRIRLGIHARDDAVANVLLLVRRSRDAGPRARAIERRADRIREREGRGSERVSRMMQRCHDLEYESMDLAERLYAFGQAAEAALRASLIAGGGSQR
jgi:hypothetical protein